MGAAPVGRDQSSSHGAQAQWARPWREPCAEQCGELHWGHRAWRTSTSPGAVRTFPLDQRQVQGCRGDPVAPSSRKQLWEGAAMAQSRSAAGGSPLPSLVAHCNLPDPVCGSASPSATYPPSPLPHWLAASPVSACCLSLLMGLLDWNEDQPVCRALLFFIPV